MIPRWDPVGNADFQSRTQSLSTRLTDFQMARFAREDVLAKVGDILVPLGLELHPFQVSKYLEASLTMSWPLVETKSFSAAHVFDKEVVEYVTVVILNVFDGV